MSFFINVPAAQARFDQATKAKEAAALEYMQAPNDTFAINRWDQANLQVESAYETLQVAKRMLQNPANPALSATRAPANTIPFFPSLKRTVKPIPSSFDRTAAAAASSRSPFSFEEAPDQKRVRIKMAAAGMMSDDPFASSSSLLSKKIEPVPPCFDETAVAAAGNPFSGQQRQMMRDDD